MAKENSNPQTAAGVVPIVAENSVDFQPAVDHARLPGYSIRRYASQVTRIAGGCQVIVELLEQEVLNDADRGDSPGVPPPVLGAFARGQLKRLLSASMQSLMDESERVMSWAYEAHTAEGKELRIAYPMRTAP